VIPALAVLERPLDFEVIEEVDDDEDDEIEDVAVEAAEVEVEVAMLSIYGSPIETLKHETLIVKVLSSTNVCFSQSISTQSSCWNRQMSNSQYQHKHRKFLSCSQHTSMYIQIGSSHYYQLRYLKVNQEFCSIRDLIRFRRWCG
jgi:hypothetical protein